MGKVWGDYKLKVLSFSQRKREGQKVKSVSNSVADCSNIAISLLCITDIIQISYTVAKYPDKKIINNSSMQTVCNTGQHRIYTCIVYVQFAFST